jgi:hypothetical protein
MTEHPWLNNLIRLTDHRTDPPHGILYRYTRDRCIQQRAHKVERLGLLALLGLPPARATCRQVRTGGKGDQHIPMAHQQWERVTLEMKQAFIVRRIQIARPRIVPAITEGLPYSAGAFTRD